MDDDHTLLDDMPQLESEDQSDSGNEDASDKNDDVAINNNDDGSGDSDGITDGEVEIQPTVHAKSSRKRGFTKMAKIRSEYVNSGGRKKRVQFDSLGRIVGKYRAQFPSFLGDLVREKVGFSVLNWKKVTKEVRDKLWEEITRYYEIDASRRKIVMRRLGTLLRSFRRKVYENDIEPYIKGPTKNLTKVEKIPRRYRTLVLNKEHWDNFVKHCQSEEFKVVSEKTKLARGNSRYQHRMGRGGYTLVQEKLVQAQVISPNEMPPRSLMWCKAHENKAGQIVDPNAKLIADKLIEHEAQIKVGQLKLDPGTDAMTLVFGKEKNGSLKGVGTGVTPNKYFNVPRSKGSSSKEMAELKSKLQNKTLENEKKEEQLKELSTQVLEQNKMLTKVLSMLHSQGMVVPGLPSHTDASLTQVVSVDMTGGSEVTPIHTKTRKQAKAFVTPEITKTSKRIFAPKSVAKIPDSPSILDSQPKTTDTQAPNGVQEIKCDLSAIEPRNIVARGTIYLSSENQYIHGLPLQDDCYRVSIDEVIKEFAFLPYETPEHQLVGKALNSFAAWPKYLVRCHETVPPTTSIQNVGPQSFKNVDLNNSKKRKKSFIRPGDIKHTRSNVKTNVKK